MTNIVQKYLNEKVNYGGYAISRKTVIKELESITKNKYAIGIYMLSMKTLTDDEASLLMSEEDYVKENC